MNIVGIPAPDVGKNSTGGITAGSPPNQHGKPQFNRNATIAQPPAGKPVPSPHPHRVWRKEYCRARRECQSTPRAKKTHPAKSRPSARFGYPKEITPTCPLRAQGTMAVMAPSTGLAAIPGPERGKPRGLDGWTAHEISLSSVFPLSRPAIPNDINSLRAHPAGAAGHLWFKGMNNET
ncbi:MAG: hypothetical protein JW748_05600 [Anaerolineales bacterium]|nr:hypothetical protein [Anaerolineales bacterium]